ncbi:flavoprotein [Streptomyces sp. DSM 41972]|uniref:Flavoprotein n=1 Tax=Streptomyces althioticus subsp. attaecolombicae TaxID=3075534 RepID=A0ABU3I3V7_9ACTN|nr:flavoprotein [Streptomyces sp. DSM 41972]
MLLVATGAIGVVHLPEWAMFLRVRYGWSVRVCLTHSAERLVSREALAAVTQAPVEGPAWETRRGVVPHQELAEWADLVIVAPATTNFLAKCAAGITDSLALTSVVCAQAPVLLAPSVPEAALARPAVQRNLRTLAEDGYHVVPMGRGVSAHRGAVAASGMPGLPAVLRVAARVLPAADDARAADPPLSGQRRDDARAADPPLSGQRPPRETPPVTPSAGPGPRRTGASRG